VLQGPRGEKELAGAALTEGRSMPKPDELSFTQNYTWKYKKPQRLKTRIYIIHAPKQNKQRLDL